VVIIILMIMGLISWLVMIHKGIYINATASANERFLNAFRKYAHEHPLHDPIWERDAETGALNGEKSNLARLLAVGLDELRGRLAAGSSHTRMRRASIAAIRSALDAAAVREGQLLHKWMVLLTIAISGGPFLGLLGTVVGVMITFAAVAAAGDVNINAIAPGIAAALLATVAGLGVAIPALFGYNYLVSRSESISADMQVFVDELEKRIAEDYTGDTSSNAKQSLRAVAGG
jgi:biopolymer transport protein ExbB